MNLMCRKTKEQKLEEEKKTIRHLESERDFLRSCVGKTKVETKFLWLPKSLYSSKYDCLLTKWLEKASILSEFTEFSGWTDPREYDINRINPPIGVTLYPLEHTMNGKVYFQYIEKEWVEE